MLLSWILQSFSSIYDAFFGLFSEEGDAILYFRPPLKPTGIAVSIINIARFPANLTVSGYARLCRRTQPANAP